MITSRYFLSGLTIIFCLSSCIPRATDEELLELFPTAPVDTISDVRKYIDSSFIAPLEMLHGTWTANYSGFDPQQDSLSNIRRQFVLSVDGNYDNYVQGIIGSSRTDFTPFEHEHGTFRYDEQTGYISYKVEYDSIVDFHTGKYQYFPFKMSATIMGVREYSEKVWFTVAANGRRAWVRQDENLRNIQEIFAPCFYPLNK